MWTHFSSGIITCGFDPISLIYWRVFNKCFWNFKVHRNLLRILLKLRFLYSKCGVGLRAVILTRLQVSRWHEGPPPDCSRLIVWDVGRTLSVSLPWRHVSIAQSSLGDSNSNSNSLGLDRGSGHRSSKIIPGDSGLGTTVAVSDRACPHQKQLKHPVCVKT